MSAARPRILMLAHGSGSFFRARGFAQQLQRRGFEATVITISARQRLRGAQQVADGVRILESPDLLWGRLRTGWDPWDVCWRWLVGRHWRPDLIQSYDTRPVSVLPAFALRRRFQVPVMTSWGDWWGRGGTSWERSQGWAHWLDCCFSPVETMFEESFHARADGVVVMSEALRQRALGLGVQPSRLRVIHHGVDMRRVTPRDRAAARRELGLPLDQPLYGYTGKLFWRDARLLLQAHEIVRQSLPGATAVLIGNVTLRAHGPDPGNVLRTGVISYEKLLTWMAACDTMLLPLFDSIANRGRWPSKVPEYMAAARPVVATRVGDIAGLFADGEAGIMTEPTPGAFAAGILQLLLHAQAEAMGARAREIAAARLTWDVQADAMQDFIRQVLGKSGG